MGPRRAAANFMELVTPLEAAGMSVSEMRDAFVRILDSMNLGPKSRNDAIRSFQNRVHQMRKTGRLRPGDEEGGPGIFDRAMEDTGFTRLGDADEQLMALRAKLVADSSAAERFVRSGKLPSARSRSGGRGGDAATGFTREDVDRLRAVLASEKRENPDLDGEELRAAVMARIMASEGLGRRSGVSSNAARLADMAPADPRGPGTRSNKFGVLHADYFGRGDFDIEAARSAHQLNRQKQERLAKDIDRAQSRLNTNPGDERTAERLRKLIAESEDPANARVVGFTSKKARTAVDGPVAKGENAYIGYDGRLYRSLEAAASGGRPSARPTVAASSVTPDEAAARSAPSAAAAAGAPDETLPTLPTLASLLEEHGDGMALYQALLEIAQGNYQPPRIETKRPVSSEDGRILIIQRRDGATTTTRMASPSQVRRGAAVAELMGQRGAKNPDQWEVRYAPAGTPHTRDPARLEEIFAAAEPLSTESVASLRPLEFPEAQAASVRLTSEEVGAISALGDLGADLAGIKPDADGMIGLLPLRQLWAAANRAKWSDLTGPGRMQQFVGAMEMLSGALARSAPNGIILPSPSRAQAREALENIFGRPADRSELTAAMRLMDRLAGQQGPELRQAERQGQAGAFTFDWRDGRSEVELGSSLFRPRALTLYHEIAHWAYEHILTPQDHMRFWRDVASKYIAEDGSLDQARLMSGLPIQPGMEVTAGKARVSLADPRVTNQAVSPQEFYASQFEAYAARMLSGEGLNEGMLDPSIWERLVKYVKALYDRYVRGVAIDPDLEPIFARILPDGEAEAFAGGVVRDPKTPTGKAILVRMQQTRDLRAAMDEALASGSESAVLNTGERIVRELLLSLYPRKSFEAGTGIFRAGSTRPIVRLARMIRQRIDDFDQVTTGQRNPGVAQGEAGIDEIAARYADGLTIIEDPGAAAEGVARLYKHGYGPEGITPEDPVVQAMLDAGKIKRVDQTSLEAMLRILDVELTKAYAAAEKGVPMGAVPESARPEMAITLSDEAHGKLVGEIRKAVGRKERVRKAAVATAKKEVSGTRTKKAASRPTRERGGRGGAPSDFEVSLAGRSTDDLVALYRKAERGTPQSEAVANALVSRVQSEPVDLAEVQGKRSATGRFFTMSGDELRSEYLSLMREGGNSAEITQATLELRKRAARRGAKRAKVTMTPTEDKSLEAIQLELRDSEGIPSEAGIPASARPQVRAALSQITHREPRVQHTSRTLAYRMLNLMGKAVHNALDNTAILTNAEVARLIRMDPQAAPRAVFVDFRGDQFKGFRSEVRRMAIGLEKGVASPIDLMHEIGHMVVRTGIVPDDEMQAVRALYRAARDDVRTNVDAAYAGLYRDRPDREALLAEEWFSEHLARYLAEREARGDILRALETGDVSQLRLRGPVSRAIDRVAEAIAYVVNGLMGTSSLRQTFRRLTFYGDLFEGVARNQTRDPLGGKMIAMHPSMAPHHAEDSFRRSPRGRRDRIIGYVGRGVGYDPAREAPVVHYHVSHMGRTLGRRLDRTRNPDAVLLPEAQGAYGRGIYVTAHADVAHMGMTRSPDTGWLRERVSRAVEGRPEVAGRANELMGALEVAISRMPGLRKEYAELSENLRRSDRGRDAASLRSRLQVLETEIDNAAELERVAISMMDQDLGAVETPMVVPVYVRVLNPADFRAGTEHASDGPFVQAILRELRQKGHLDEDGAMALRDILEESGTLPGSMLHADLVDALEFLGTRGGGGSSSPEDTLNSVLRGMGYDGVIFTDRRVTQLDGEMARDGFAFGARPEDVEMVMAFDARQAKHVDAEVFDTQSAQLYYRQPVPAGVVGREAAGIIDQSAEGLMPARVAEIIEAAGGSPELSDAVMSMARGRQPSFKDRAVLAVTSPPGWLSKQSQRFERMGMNWLAPWYAENFPAVTERFARKWDPIQRKLWDLPDARGALSGWFYKATGGVGQKLPESHGRIFRALVHGRASRQTAVLSPAEREVYDAIIQTNREVFQEMRAAGIQVGDLGDDYFTQVWDPAAIQKDREGFLQAMAGYQREERARMGLDFDQDEANRFAERMFETLGGEQADGVFLPGASTPTPYSGSRNPEFENADFSRMLRLRDHPEALKALEKYLEKDITAIQVKYLEGAMRRLNFVEKMGVNGHAFGDYLMAAVQGREGIARLLSSNKEFSKPFQALDEFGSPRQVTLKDVVRMPFSSEGGEGGPGPAAFGFVDELMEAFRAGGAPAAHEMLMSVAPRDALGQVPVAYERRADAILGALGDYGGEPARLRRDDLQFAENAMRVLMRSRQMGTSNLAMKASQNVRNFNNVSLLGFTTLTSLGDLGLPILRSGSMRSWLKGVRELVRDPDYRAAIHSTGVAMESMIHERMLHLYGGTPSKVTTSFFNATLLTPWTDMARMVGGATGFETLKAMQRQALRNWDPSRGGPDAQNRKYRIAHRFLNRYGLGEFLPSGPRAGESLDAPALIAQDPAVRRAVIRFADESVFIPNPNDIPLWAQTPLGAVVFQLKSFPLQMMRLATDLVAEARKGNPSGLIYLLTVGAGFGTTANAVKDIVQMRGGEENREAAFRERTLEGMAERLGFDPRLHGDVDTFLGWYTEGLLLAGGFGLISDILIGVAEQAENDAYGRTRMMSLFLGPTMGLMFDGAQLVQGAHHAVFGEDDSVHRERAALRAAMSRVPVAGGVRAAREGAVDAMVSPMDRGQSWRGEFSTGDWRGEF